MQESVTDTQNMKTNFVIFRFKKIQFHFSHFDPFETRHRARRLKLRIHSGLTKEKNVFLAISSINRHLQQTRFAPRIHIMRVVLVNVQTMLYTFVTPPPHLILINVLSVRLNTAILIIVMQSLIQSAVYCRNCNSTSLKFSYKAKNGVLIINNKNNNNLVCSNANRLSSPTSPPVIPCTCVADSASGRQRPTINSPLIVGAPTHAHTSTSWPYQSLPVADL